MYNLRAKWYHRIFFTTFWLLLKIMYCKIRKIEFTDSMLSIMRSPFRMRPQAPFANSTPSNANTTQTPPFSLSNAEIFNNRAFERLPSDTEINLMGTSTPPSLHSEFDPSNPFSETFESVLEMSNEV